MKNEIRKNLARYTTPKQNNLRMLKGKDHKNPSPAERFREKSPLPCCEVFLGAKYSNRSLKKEMVSGGLDMKVEENLKQLEQKIRASTPLSQSSIDQIVKSSISDYLKHNLSKHLEISIREEFTEILRKEIKKSFLSPHKPPQIVSPSKYQKLNLSHKQAKADESIAMESIPKKSSSGEEESKISISNRISCKGHLRPTKRNKNFSNRLSLKRIDTPSQLFEIGDFSDYQPSSESALLPGSSNVGEEDLAQKNDLISCNISIRKREEVGSVIEELSSIHHNLPEFKKSKSHFSVFKRSCKNFGGDELEKSKSLNRS